ncbi:MAG: DUF3299 domain-containing protein, partial [Pseudomonadota bacterium]
SLWAQSALAEAIRLNWPALIDEASQEFEDPYAALSPEALSDLVTVARLRTRLDGGDLSAEVRARIEARLADTAARLTDAGVDIDWLISQRWVVAERREAAAMSGNPFVDGRIVTMTGFAIPAPPDADGSAVAYLVPERGMCSHMPPPNPNQMIRIRYPGDAPLRIHEPVEVTGRIDIAPNAQVMRVVDGMVPMRATFTLDADVVLPLVQKPAQPDSDAWGSTFVGHLGTAEPRRQSAAQPQ